jgi:hypothetical protein
MRDLGVQRLVASCLNDVCRHEALIDGCSYPAETEIPYFKSRVVCAKCGARGNKIDVRPNWKSEQLGQPSRQRMAMSKKRRAAWRRGLIMDALFAVVFASVIVLLAHLLW